MGIMVETREGVKQPSRKNLCTRQETQETQEMRETRNLLNLHLLFFLRTFRQKLDRLLPRPDSSKLHHPPLSLANCGPAETDEIFRAVGGVLQGQVAPETR